MKKEIRKYQIGDWVTADYIVVPEYHREASERDNNYNYFNFQPSYLNRILVRKPKSIHGQIVGATYRQEGVYHPASNGSSYYGESEYEPAMLSPDKYVLVWQVKQGVLNKPVEVLFEDLRPAIGMFGGVPWRWFPPSEYDAAYRRILSEEAKKQAREPNGRFKKVV